MIYVNNVGQGWESNAFVLPFRSSFRNDFSKSFFGFPEKLKHRRKCKRFDFIRSARMSPIRQSKNVCMGVFAVAWVPLRSARSAPALLTAQELFFLPIIPQPQFGENELFPPCNSFKTAALGWQRAQTECNQPVNEGRPNGSWTKRPFTSYQPQCQVLKLNNIRNV